MEHGLVRQVMVGVYLKTGAGSELGGDLISTTRSGRTFQADEGRILSLGTSLGITRKEVGTRVI